jgi:hypothetical protein
MLPWLFTWNSSLSDVVYKCSHGQKCGFLRRKLFATCKGHLCFTNKVLFIQGYKNIAEYFYIVKLVIFNSV